MMAEPWALIIVTAISTQFPKNNTFLPFDLCPHYSLCQGCSLDYIQLAMSFVRFCLGVTPSTAQGLLQAQHSEVDSVSAGRWGVMWCWSMGDREGVEGSSCGDRNEIRVPACRG